MQSLQNGNQARISKHKKGNHNDHYDRNDTFPNHRENENKKENNEESEDEETVFESDDENPRITTILRSLIPNNDRYHRRQEQNTF